jgi:putative membrane protein
MIGWAWIWPALILAGLLLIGYAAVRVLRDGVADGSNGAASARRMLDERYARGEIDEQQHRRQRNELERR